MFPLEFEARANGQVWASVGPLRVAVESEGSDLVLGFTSVNDLHFCLDRRVSTSGPVSLAVQGVGSVAFSATGHIGFSVTHEGVIVDVWDPQADPDGAVDSVALEWADVLGEVI